MWLKATVITAVALMVAIPGIIVWGASRWKAGTKALHTKLEDGRLPVRLETYDVRDIESLPSPVRRYFHAVLSDGQPIISAVRLTHEGQFNMGETKTKWRRFTSSQLVITQRPGFDWNARIAMVPGLNVFVHDAYIAGEGVLNAKLLGLVTLAESRGTPEAAQGELMRFLAEAAWYPTALLSGQGVHWEAVDDESARASLTDGATTVSLDFHFGDDGLISSVRTAARYRTLNGELVATPWQGRFWDYELTDGLRIPLEGEVAWELPNGLWPYWRGHVTEIAYEFL